MQYNVTAEVAAAVHDADAFVDALAGYSPAIGIRADRADITITIPADSLEQAVRTGLAVIAHATARDVLAVEVLRTDDFDRRNGLAPIPELVSTAEASELLGVSRQAIAQQIERGRFTTATRVGTTWAIARAEIERLLA